MNKNGSGFLQTIIECPTDDTPRLIFADWLEEQGSPLGEFIRVQCRLAVLKRTPCTPSCVCAEETLLGKREKQLLQPHWMNWYPVLPASYIYCTNLLNGPVAHGYNITFQRGFVAKIGLTIHTFLQYTDTLFSTAPIEEVYLHDKSPQRGNFGISWFSESHGASVSHDADDRLSDLPDSLFHQLNQGEIYRLHGIVRWRDYSTAQEATTDLSHACITLGRQRAGLPIITPHDHEKNSR